MNMKSHFPQWLSLVDATVILVMALLIGSHIGTAYQNYEVRQRVAEALKLASQAQRLVEGNATQGLAFDEGWRQLTMTDEVVISIAQGTGIITVDFPSDIDGGGKNLTLVPVRGGSGAGGIPLGRDASGSWSSTSDAITWICTASNATRVNTYAMAHKGTLNSRFAPARCR